MFNTQTKEEEANNILSRVSDDDFSFFIFVVKHNSMPLYLTTALGLLVCSLVLNKL